MGTTKKVEPNPPRKRPPGISPEARQSQLEALAYDLAEEQLRKKTASSQVITHFLKTASIEKKKELLLLEQEIELKKAKTEAIQSSKRIEELYTNALDAMSLYTGTKGRDENDRD